MKIVLLATAWGPKHGGINAFNKDFALAVGRVLGSGRVASVVLTRPTPEEVARARVDGVTLLGVPELADAARFDSSRAHDVLAVISSANFGVGPDVWWLGHDIHTGELANRIVHPEVGGPGRSVVIQHMSFRDYMSYRDRSGPKALDKFDRQRRVFRAAHCAFAVGPLLLERLGETGVEPHEIMPGLASIEPTVRANGAFRVVVFGRMGLVDDRVKQGRLAAAAFVTACNSAQQGADEALAATMRGAELLVYGVDNTGSEESDFRALVEGHAKQYLNVIPVPFEEDRDVLFERLRECDVAMMLSVHEGFGLVAWESIAAGIPLILSRNSGAFMAIERVLGDAGVALLRTAVIRGFDGPASATNFGNEDCTNVANCLLQIARNRGKAKKNALELREALLSKQLTWESAARHFVDVLAGLPVPKKRAKWDIEQKGTPYLGFEALGAEHAQLFFGRDSLVADLFRRFNQPDSRFLAVIGDSGSGKSSLVAAGLLPQLSDWAIVQMRPAAANGDPLAALAEALVSLAPSTPKQFERARSLNRELHALSKAERNEAAVAAAHLVDKAVKQHGSPSGLLLFIDQFEEIFAIDVKAGDLFLALIERLLSTDRVRIVATLRVDFLGRFLSRRKFGSELAVWLSHCLLVAAPDVTALAQMIEGPAEAAGIDLDEGLTTLICEETGTRPGNLALMAYTLNQLCDSEALSSRRLSLAKYEQLGRVQGVVARKANERFADVRGVLGAQAETLLGRAFGLLLHVDPETLATTRRRVARAVLCADPGVEQLVEAFLDARLLVAGSDPVESYGQVADSWIEVAHEALFRSWHELADWIEKNFDDLRLRSQLDRATAEWLATEKSKRAALLWSDSRVVDVIRMLQRLDSRPTADQKAFLGPIDVPEMLLCLSSIETNHADRSLVGMRLSLLGDQRPGVGVESNGVPDIAWCAVPAGSVALDKVSGDIAVERFFISKYPITQAQYSAFVADAEGYRSARWWEELERPSEGPGIQIPRGAASYPAVNVDWCEAMAFCRWLSDRLGLQVRLPYEWEWQQAASWGRSDYEFPWGSSWDAQRANTRESGLWGTVAVGCYDFNLDSGRPSDLVGNVWQFCLNSFAAPVSLDDDPPGARKQPRGAVRGGSWIDNHFETRIKRRIEYLTPPNYRFDNVGFRVACKAIHVPTQSAGSNQNSAVLAPVGE